MKIVFCRCAGHVGGQGGPVVDQEMFGGASVMAALQNRRPGGAQARSDDHHPLERGCNDREIGRAAIFVVADRHHVSRYGIVIRNRRGFSAGFACSIEGGDRGRLPGEAMHQFRPDLDRAGRIAIPSILPGDPEIGPEFRRKTLRRLATPGFRVCFAAGDGQSIGELDPAAPKIRKICPELLGTAQKLRPILASPRHPRVEIGEPRISRE